jgi:hypothetical protein
MVQIKYNIKEQFKKIGHSGITESKLDSYGFNGHRFSRYSSTV